jgi:pre-mRNA-splicing factor SYF1
MPTATPTFAQLSSLFPLTHPIPNPKTHPELITSSDLHREEDLLRNPNSFRAWWSAINNVKESYSALQKKGKQPSDLPADVTPLLGPLASPLARIYLQRLTYLYEVALQQFAGSFKLWKAYLNMRLSFVCGKLIIRKRAGGKKKFPEMKEALEEEMEDIEEWENGLDGILGWEEWKALVATFERALMWLPKVRPVV